MSVKALAVSCWLAVAIILGLVCFFSARVSEGAESVHTGHIKEDTRICEFDKITHDTIGTLNTYTSLINKLEAVGIDGLTQVERMLGSFLTNQIGCGTVAVDYRVVILFVDGNHALFLFDEGYGFEPIVHLMLLSFFHADEVL